MKLKNLLKSLSEQNYDYPPSMQLKYSREKLDNLLNQKEEPELAKPAEISFDGIDKPESVNEKGSVSISFRNEQGKVYSEKFITKDRELLGKMKVAFKLAPNYLAKHKLRHIYKSNPDVEFESNRV